MSFDAVAWLGVVENNAEVCWFTSACKAEDAPQVRIRHAQEQASQNTMSCSHVARRPSTSYELRVPKNRHSGGARFRVGDAMRGSKPNYQTQKLKGSGPIIAYGGFAKKHTKKGPR